MTARANLGPEWRNEFAGVMGTLRGWSQDLGLCFPRKGVDIKVQLSTSLLRQVALPWLNVNQPRGLDAKANDVHLSAPYTAPLRHTTGNGSEPAGERQRGLGGASVRTGGSGAPQ